MKDKTERIAVADKQFELFITSEQIQKTIQSMAQQINRDLAGKDPLFLVILNGAFMFAADLLKLINTPCHISFVKLASYAGTTSTEKVQELIGINEDLKGRLIVVVEDIIDTGITMDLILNRLHNLGAAEIRIAALLFKPRAFLRSFSIDYIGMEIPNDFIIGYGLDYNGYGRNYPDIYRIVESL